MSIRGVIESHKKSKEYGLKMDWESYIPWDRARFAAYDIQHYMCWKVKRWADRRIGLVGEPRCYACGQSSNFQIQSFLLAPSDAPHRKLSLKEFTAEAESAMQESRPIQDPSGGNPHTGAFVTISTCELHLEAAAAFIYDVTNTVSVECPTDRRYRGTWDVNTADRDSPEYKLLGKYFLFE